MGKIAFLTGPVRSGKSRRAVELAQVWGDGVVFVATYRVDPSDAEMVARVARHRAERPAWCTLEAPLDIAVALAALQPPPSGVVVDCLTLWLGDRLDASDDTIRAAWAGQLAQWRGGTVAGGDCRQRDWLELGAGASGAAAVPRSAGFTWAGDGGRG